MRRLLIALLFCLTVWAALTRTPATADATTHPATDVASSTASGASQGAGNSDSRWDVAHRACVPVTESLWKSAAVHADLAAERSGDALIETGTVTRRDRPAGERPAHLLHIPLLI